MAEIEVDISSTEQICRRAADLAKQEGISASKVHDAGSNAEALNAPLGGAEIIIAAKVITVLFTAALAGIKFIKELRSTLTSKEAIAVRPKSGVNIIITQKTTDAEIEILFGD